MSTGGWLGGGLEIGGDYLGLCLVLVRSPEYPGAIDYAVDFAPARDELFFVASRAGYDSLMWEAVVFYLE